MNGGCSTGRMQRPFFGNTQGSPIRAQRQQHSLRPLWGTDHGTCSANQTPFIIFSLKVSYQTAAYCIPTDGPVCLYCTTGQPSRRFTSPQARSPAVMPPAHSHVLWGSSGMAALALGSVSHHPPWEQHHARHRQRGCSKSPFLLHTCPS